MVLLSCQLRRVEKCPERILRWQFPPSHVHTASQAGGHCQSETCCEAREAHPPRGGSSIASNQPIFATFSPDVSYTVEHPIHSTSFAVPVPSAPYSHSYLASTSHLTSYLPTWTTKSQYSLWVDAISRDMDVRQQD